MTVLLERLRVTCLTAALFMAPLLFWPWARESYRVVKEAALAACLFPALAVWWMSRRPGLDRVPAWYKAVAAGFMAWCVIRIPGTADQTAALARGGEWFLALASAAAALGLAAREGRRAIDVLLSVTALASLMGLAQHVLGWQAFTPYAVDERSVTFTAERVFSTFGNPIFFAGFLILVFPLVVAGLVEARPKEDRRRFVFLLAVAVLQLAALVFAASRSAYLGLAAGLAVLAALSSAAARRRVAVLAAGAVGLTLVIGALRPALLGHLLARGDPGRVVMWRNTIAMCAERPFTGAGLGQFAREYPCVQQRTGGAAVPGAGINAVYAHNDCLQAAAELGIPGGILFAAVVLGVLLLPGSGMRAGAVKAGAIAVAVHSLFNFPFHNAPTQMFFFLIPALVLLSADGRRENPPEAARPGTVKPVLALLAAVAGAAFFAHFLLRSAYFQWALAYQDARKYDRAGIMFDRALSLMADDVHSRLEFNRGRLLFETGDLNGAMRLFEKDMSLFPCSPEGYGNLGVVYGVRAQRGEPGALEKARQLIGTALKLRPDGKEAAGDHNSLGNLKFMAGDEPGAVESYLDALRCDPGYAEAAVNAIHLLVKLRKRERAVEVLRAVLRERPGHPELLGLARSLGLRP